MPADGGSEQPAPYRPRHARSLDAQRARRSAATQRSRTVAAPAAVDDAVKAPGLAAMFRRNPERARRTAIAAGAVAVCVLVASSVASAATRTGSHDDRPVAKSVGLDGNAVPKTAATSATAAAAGPKVAAAARIVRAKQFAPANKAVISGLAGNGIPNVALNAYRVAADRMAHVQPSCGIDWALLAGIGREESDHGRFAGARLNPDGTSTPRIIGPALNGVGNEYIAAPANGFALDGDAKYTHALGPMQFIPQTWAGYGADANGDGKADIFNINDAALGAARYLCANGGNLRTAAGQERAILAYNHSDQYLAQVLALSDAYRIGVPVTGIPVGNITGALPPITATEPFAANPGPPTAASSSGNTRAGGPSTKPGSGLPSGTTGGGTGTKGTKGGTGSGGGTGGGSGGGSGRTPTPTRTPSPTRKPKPTPTPDPTGGGSGGGLPIPSTLPTTLPTKLPTPSSSAATSPKPTSTCVVGVGGICVIH